MANITIGGNPCQTIGDLPEIGQTAPNVELSRDDLSSTDINSFRGKRLVMNIFPSIGTGVCAASTRRFNEEASSMNNTVVACISKDLPFAAKHFCEAEGLDNVVMLSDFKNGDFGKTYGVTLVDGAFAGLHARAIVILDEQGRVTYTEQVPEIGQEPDYDSALKAVNS